MFNDVVTLRWLSGKLVNHSAGETALTDRRAGCSLNRCSSNAVIGDKADGNQQIGDKQP